MLIRSERLTRNQGAIMQEKGAAASELERLLRNADKALERPCYTVTDKPAAGPSGDKRDYLSLATYFWPNPNTPDGLPYIQKDGQRNPETERYDIARMSGLCDTVQTLTLAYHFTGQEKYAEKAARQLRVWFLDEATRMNPNLNYSQMVKGQGNEGMPYGLIDSRRLTLLGDAMKILRKSKSWSTEDQAGMGRWFDAFLTWFQTSRLGNSEGSALNNHGIWYDVQVAAFALYCGKTEMARSILEEAKTKRIAAQVEPDGSQPGELKRTRSLTYVLFNLNAMVSLAMLGDEVGVDIWNYSDAQGRGLRKAIDWVIPYAKGQKPWTHQQISSEKEDGYGPFVGLLRQAALAYHEPKYEQLIAELKNVDGARKRAELLWPAR
jgi:hypothetical protein